MLEQYSGKVRAAEIAPHWRGCAFDLLENKNLHRIVLLYSAEWDTEVAAREYFAAYRRQLSQKWKNMAIATETDDAVKKQIVTASLKAFAVPVEQIVEATAQELQALEAYIRAGASDTEKVTSEAELRIKQNEEEIVKLKSVMQQRVEEQQAVVKRCNEKKLEIQKVLEFFGQETVARVVRDSPKLKEPAAG